eukprot:Phypoly_transcript_09172.p2 GENE.Phypoly_transcript_09172~~Phypoly_transcript_09172.p2  ORF type:complete len:115 (+),score=17.32 Phypoly_transcript_09172:454-798(+)
MLLTDHATLRHGEYAELINLFDSLPHHQKAPATNTLTSQSIRNLWQQREVDRSSCTEIVQINQTHKQYIHSPHISHFGFGIISLLVQQSAATFRGSSKHIKFHPFAISTSPFHH